MNCKFGFTDVKSRVLCFWDSDWFDCFGMCGYWRRFQNSMIDGCHKYLYFLFMRWLFPFLIFKSDVTGHILKHEGSVRIVRIQVCKALFLFGLNLFQVKHSESVFMIIFSLSLRKIWSVWKSLERNYF